MAGRFERPFEPQRPGGAGASGKMPLHKSATISAFSANDVNKARSGSVSNRWQPSVIAHAKEQDASRKPISAISKDWLTGDVSEDEPPSKARQAAADEEEDSKIFASRLQAPSTPPVASNIGAASANASATASVGADEGGKRSKSTSSLLTRKRSRSRKKPLLLVPLYHHVYLVIVCPLSPLPRSLLSPLHLPPLNQKTKASPPMASPNVHALPLVELKRLRGS